MDANVKPEGAGGSAFDEEEYNSLRAHYFDPVVQHNVELAGGRVLRTQTSPPRIDQKTPGFKALKRRIGELDKKRDRLAVWHLLRQLRAWETRPPSLGGVAMPGAGGGGDITELVDVSEEPEHLDIDKFILEVVLTKVVVVKKDPDGGGEITVSRAMPEPFPAQRAIKPDPEAPARDEAPAAKRARVDGDESQSDSGHDKSESDSRIETLLPEERVTYDATTRQEIASARLAALRAAGRGAWAEGLELTELTSRVVEDPRVQRWGELSNEDDDVFKAYEGIPEGQLTGYRCQTRKDQTLTAVWTSSDGKRIRITQTYTKWVVWRYVGTLTGEMIDWGEDEPSECFDWSYKWEPDDTDYWGPGNETVVYLIEADDVTFNLNWTHDYLNVSELSASASENPYSIRHSEPLPAHRYKMAVDCVALSCSAFQFYDEITFVLDTNSKLDLARELDQVLKSMKVVKGVPNRVHGFPLTKTPELPDDDADGLVQDAERETDHIILRDVSFAERARSRAMSFITRRKEQRARRNQRRA